LEDFREVQVVDKGGQIRRRRRRKQHEKATQGDERDIMHELSLSELPGLQGHLQNTSQGSQFNTAQHQQYMQSQYSSRISRSFVKRPARKLKSNQMIGRAIYYNHGT